MQWCLLISKYILRSILIPGYTYIPSWKILQSLTFLKMIELIFHHTIHEYYRINILNELFLVKKSDSIIPFQYTIRALYINTAVCLPSTSCSVFFCLVRYSITMRPSWLDAGKTRAFKSTHSHAYTRTHTHGSLITGSDKVPCILKKSLCTELFAIFFICYSYC